MPLPPWDQHSIRDLLTLEPMDGGVWRNRHGDANLNGRSYGGQLLGQAMAAALQGVPEARPPSMMQFLFLQGAVPDAAIDFVVTPLQDGKRFSSRHVRGTQGGRVVADAQVTCATELEAPRRADPSPADPAERPEDLPTFDALPPALRKPLVQLSGYSENRKPSLDFRIPDAERQLGMDTATPSFRFWMKTCESFGDDAALQAAAFAYISDWWLNFSSLVTHLREAQERRLYVASLNHAVWLHRPPRADDWLHVQTTSPSARAGRGLSVARVHDRHGRCVASATQECLMGYA